MNKLFILSLTLLFSLILVGCGGPDAPVADDANAKIKAMPAQERFDLIKADGVMSPMQRGMAIENLPVDQATKDKWKAEVGAPAITPNPQ